MSRLIQLMLIFCVVNLSVGPSLIQAFHQSEISQNSNPCADKDDDCEDFTQVKNTTKSVFTDSFQSTVQRHDTSDDCNGPSCPSGISCHYGQYFLVLPDSVTLYVSAVNVKIKELHFMFKNTILSPPTKPPIALV